MFAGIDIGSRTICLVELSGRREDGGLNTQLINTGPAPLESALSLMDGKKYKLLVATGYGRHLARTNFAGEVLTEIKAFALGVKHLFPEAGTVLDIGGQDTKVILLDRDTGVADFEMNEKCAAGTGKFLEVMAGALGYSIEELGEKALMAESEINISSMCTVFAESEVVSLLHKGARREDVAFGVHNAIAKRAVGMLKRIDYREPLVFAGGVAKNPCLVRIIGEELKAEVLVPKDPQMVGALGAALHGQRLVNG